MKQKTARFILWQKRLTVIRKTRRANKISTLTLSADLDKITIQIV
jgi:hypothetical protein